MEDVFDVLQDFNVVSSVVGVRSEVSRVRVKINPETNVHNTLTDEGPQRRKEFP